MPPRPERSIHTTGRLWEMQNLRSPPALWSQNLHSQQGPGGADCRVGMRLKHRSEPEKHQPRTWPLAGRELALGTQASCRSVSTPCCTEVLGGDPGRQRHLGRKALFRNQRAESMT